MRELPKERFEDAYEKPFYNTCIDFFWSNNRETVKEYSCKPSKR